MKKPKITFSESAIPFILEAFNKIIDKQGYIAEKDTKQRILTPEGEEILAKNLGGIVKGKKNTVNFIKDDLCSLMNYVERSKKAKTPSSL